MNSILELLLDEAISIEPWTNMFFYPGAARSKVCRQGLKYDSFVPSILFLTHFLPDKPRFSQNNALAALMLGGNGIWGDLTLLNDEDISVFAETLSKYKKVAESVNNSYPRFKGFIGSSHEIYEKIDYEKAEGLVCFFTRGAGEFEYVTEKINLDKFSHVDGADSYEVTPGGSLKIMVSLEQNDARYVFVFAK